LLTVLSQRSGIKLERLRCMSFAGWVPWLLDSLDSRIPDALETYAFQFSVLLPNRSRKTRSITSWRAWLPTQPIRRACPLYLNDSEDQAVLLAWKLPLMLSCPQHACWLEFVVRPHGEQAALFLLEPQTRFTHGLPEKKRKPEPVDRWREVVKALNEVIAKARLNRETARSLFALASYGRRDPESLDCLRLTFAQLGIPPEFVSHYFPVVPFAYHSQDDGLSDCF